MTAIGYVVKEMVLTIEPAGGSPVDYACAITGVRESENHTEQTSQTGCADGTIVDVGPSSWSIEITHNVSLLPDSLFRLLRDHAGEAATVTIEPFPIQEPGHTISWDVTLIPSGGDFTVGSFATSTPPLPVKGSPVHTDPTP